MLYDKRWDVEPAPVKELEPWQEVIIKMIEVLKRDGWCRGALENQKGEKCLLGAQNFVQLGEAVSTSSYRPALHEEVRRKMQQHICNDIVGWNNSEGRTKEEVIEALRELVAK